MMQFCEDLTTTKAAVRTTEKWRSRESKEERQPPLYQQLRGCENHNQGEVPDYAAIARLGYVTRARLTQIMNLILLAPDIQEAILFQTKIPQGRSSGERAWRTLTAEPNWKRQREWAAARNGN